MSNDTAAIVTNDYEAILNRAPSANEVTGWSNLIDQGILTVDQVQADIIASPEAQQNVVPIVDLFQAVLGRVPDQAGLQYWVGTEESQGLSLQQVAQAALSSPEGQGIYGSGTDINVTFLSALYKDVFNRAPDTAGLNYWLSQNGVLSRADVVVALINSAEGQADLNPLANQFLAAAAQGLPTAYSGSLYANASQPQGQPQGSTVALTKGVDVLTGTAGNDTFVGTVNPGIFSSGILSNSTLNPGDRIDGGAGSNTLQIVDSSGADNNDLAGVTLTNIQTVALENSLSGSDATVDFTLTPGVSNVIALNSAANTIDSFTGLATGAQVIASGAGTGGSGSQGTTIDFAMAKPSDAVSVGVAGGVNHVSFHNVAGSTTSDPSAATISSTGAANGTSAVDQFDLTGTAGSLKTLSINAATNLVAELNLANYVATGAALTVSGNATSVDLSANGQTGFKTIDASGLTNGGLTIDVGPNLTSLTGGAGNDVITLLGALKFSTTINLGAGNDKLLGSVAPSAGVTIDGGAGINTLSSALVTSGNASDFTNFQDLSLQSASGVTFDTSLIMGVTALSVDQASAGATYTNLTTTDTLTDNFVGNNSQATNTLGFTGLSGTSNAYSIAFNGAAQTTAVTAPNVQLGTIDATGINDFNINSGGGANTWNSLTLGADPHANTVTITGAQNLNLNFLAGFGSSGPSNSLVSSIDGSAATGNLTIDTTNVTPATGAIGSLENGLTITGGSGNDTLIAITNATLTGGAGADTINAMNFLNSATSMASITDFTAGSDKLVLAGTNTNTFTSQAANVSAATDLSTALNMAIHGATANAADWFNFSGNTYVVQDNSGNANTFTAGTDHVVQLAGSLDLSHLTLNNHSVLA